MTEQRKNNGISSGVVAAIAIGAIAVAGVAGYFAFNKSADIGKVPEPALTTPPNQDPTQLPGTTKEKIPTVYWLQDNGTGLSLVPQNVQVQADINKPSEFLKATFELLLAGPTEGTGSSTIPAETKLLSIKAQGDEVRVNLSEDFQFGGGSASMIGRVGQVLYTATALNENAKVYLELNGEPVEVLGGEGLELQQPLTRDNYLKNFEL